MVRVGQVYYHPKINKHLVITFVGDGYCSWITSEGKICEDSIKWIEQIGELVAEYHTWKEAINSKEFDSED